MASESTAPLSNVGMFLASPVGRVMRSDVAILEADMTAEDALQAMQEKKARNVLVSRKGEVVGLVSKTDILFKVTSQGRGPSKVRVREIMTSPVLAVGPQTTIREALSVMDKNKVRQVMVHAYAAVLGMANRDDILESIKEISLELEDAALLGTPACIIDTKTITYTKDLSKAKFQCPYCGSPFDTKEVLSKHIDRIHEEAGVLEGDYRKIAGG
ncbi:MAG TPA: CBS domain-containing protein [Nitrososphaera sp.]|jgi:CBS domain-containing protein|nr:CBS domain-containing protein [Nitrososphaera sp.]